MCSALASNHKHPCFSPFYAFCDWDASSLPWTSLYLALTNHSQKKNFYHLLDRSQAWLSRYPCIHVSPALEDLELADIRTSYYMFVLSLSLLYSSLWSVSLSVTFLLHQYFFSPLQPIPLAVSLLLHLLRSLSPWLLSVRGCPWIYQKHIYMILKRKHNIMVLA